MGLWAGGGVTGRPAQRSARLISPRREFLRVHVLGFEGTAHTCGVGIVDDGGRVLANARSSYAPEEGGIHPREAANHHAEVLPSVLRDALDEAGLSLDAIDAVAFSQGPGLGPCLRTVATAARALALRRDLPLVGVNHCVAHLEIGRHVAGMEDPVLLYVSGGNTQVIGYARGRYRVMGETLDVGVGNLLDKFAREHGLAFPGGPKVERLAAEARDGGADPIELPYSVKGMDVAFSGILTAALNKSRANGGDADLPELCFALEETVFAMLTEVTERALAHLGNGEVVLGGGVACNARLRGMVATMAAERGAGAAWPEPGLCVDNGAMIAYTGKVMLDAGATTPVEDSGVDQAFRTDDVKATWRDPDHRPPVRRIEGPRTCAEAVVSPDVLVLDGTGDDAEPDGHRPVMVKERISKGYRHAVLDARLRRHRTGLEARLLRQARAAGVPTPFVLAADGDGTTLTLQRLEGPTLREALADGRDADADAALLADAGRLLAKLHDAGLVHGDPTTSNFLATPDGIACIDFGLGAVAPDDPEAFGVDLHVLKEALAADGLDEAFAHAMEGYLAASGRPKAVEAKLAEIEERGRYRGS